MRPPFSDVSQSCPGHTSFDTALARKLALTKPYYDEALRHQNGLVNPLTGEPIVFHSDITDAGRVQVQYYSPG